MDDDFRIFFRSLFLQKLKRNSRYSLRALARDLKLDASLICKLMRGQRSPTKRVLAVISNHFKVDLETLKQKYFRQSKPERLAWNTLTENESSYITNWAHIATMMLIDLKNFKPSIVHIAKALNINKQLAQAVVEDLIRAGLIEVQAHDKWEVKYRFLQVADPKKVLKGRKTSAVKSVTESVMAKAQRHWQEYGDENASYSFNIFQADAALLSEVIKAIHKYRRRIAINSEKSGRPDSIYCLSMALFPICKSV